MKRCRHRSTRHMRWTGEAWELAARGINCAGWIAPSHGAVVCNACGAWIPLGPATDDERTRVEERAALLATSWKPVGGVRKIITPDESRGWNGWPYRQPENDGEWTGFLAAQIRNHEHDLGDVNWAGQHMADHPLDPRAIAEHTEES